MVEIRYENTRIIWGKKKVCDGNISTMNVTGSEWLSV